MASSKFSSLILFLVLISSTCVLALSSSSSPPLFGGWQPIDNVNDQEIQELAKFALAEQNKLDGAGLQFGRVLGGEQQVVSGYNYKLILAASDGNGNDGKYEAVVWVKPWVNFKKLTSFRSV